jgi:RND family efflux transporter MFP subunit
MVELYPERNQKHHRPRLVLAVSLIMALLAGCSLLPNEEEALKPPLVKPAEEQYNTVKVERGTVAKEIRGNGTFESVHTEYAQFTEQGGRVKEVLVKAGDMVKKGDLLIQLDVEGLDLKLKEQELALEKSKIAHKKAWADSSKDPDTMRIASMQAEIEEMKYERLMKAFKDRQLYAKMDGQIIYATELKPGDMVAVYQTLITIADPTRMRLSLRIDNTTEASDANIGMEAAIKANKENLTGTVVQTPSSAPPTTDKALAEKNAKTLYIALPKLPSDSKLGGIVEVTVPTQKRENVLKIPRSALRNYMGRTFVQVLDGKTLREIDVEIGLQAPTEIEIVKGLKEGQDIVVN